VGSFKIGEKLLFPESVHVIITNHIHNATNNNISKLSGKLRSYIEKNVLWQSAIDNAYRDMLPALRQLRSAFR